jgi:DNA polymerase
MDPEVTACERCPALVESRSRIVNGVGPTDADLVLVGEAPGADEDEGGEPFVGRSGTVLDEALSAAGLARADVRITNCVRCRPPENRDPRAEELGHCRGYLERELAVVDPELVVALGKVPAEHLLDASLSVTRAAGEIREAALDEPRSVLVCVHPAATLYDRSQRAGFEAAIEKAASFVGGGGQSRLGEF